MDSAANNKAQQAPQAPLPTPVKRRGRGNFSSGLRCDAPVAPSSEPPSLARHGAAPVIDASILRADDATKQRALPPHLAAFKDASDAAAMAKASSTMVDAIDIEAESDRLVSSNVGETVREQLFRKERRRRHIIFIGNMYALAGGLPFGTDDNLGVPNTNAEEEVVANNHTPVTKTSEDSNDNNDAISATTTPPTTAVVDPVVADRYMAISRLSAEQRSQIKNVAFWGAQQGVPEGLTSVVDADGNTTLIQNTPHPSSILAEPLFFLEKYHTPALDGMGENPESPTNDSIHGVDDSVVSVAGSAAPGAAATSGGTTSSSPGYHLSKLRRIEHRIVCRVQALKREREIGCRVRLIKHRGAKPARLAAKYIMGITLSLDAVAGLVGDEEVEKFPAALFTEDKVLRTLLKHLQAVYGRSNLLRSGGKQVAAPGSAKTATATVTGGASSTADVIEEVGSKKSTTTASPDTTTTPSTTPVNEDSTTPVAPVVAVEEEGAAVVAADTPDATAGTDADVVADAQKEAPNATPVISTTEIEGEDEHHNAEEEEEEGDDEAYNQEQRDHLVACQRRVVAMQAGLQDGVHPLTVAESEGGGTEATIDTYHAMFYDHLTDEYQRAVGRDALARESMEDSTKRREQYDKIAALAARKIVGLTSPVLTSYRFSNLPSYLTSELRRLWNSEDIRKQKVTIKLEFGKAYFSTSSSDPVGQLFGQGAKLLGSRGHRFYKGGDDEGEEGAAVGVSNNPHDKPVFPTLVSKLNSETAQLYYINDAPLTVARAMDLVCAKHGKKNQKEVVMPQTTGAGTTAATADGAAAGGAQAEAATTTTLIGPSNCERIKYSSVRIYFFSKLKQTHVVTRAVWDSQINAFKLVDIEHIGITFSWLMMHLGSKNPHLQAHSSDSEEAEDKDIPPPAEGSSKDHVEGEGGEGEKATNKQKKKSDAPFSSTFNIPSQDRLRCLPVELQFRAFHRSKAASSLDTKQATDESTVYHPIETKARSILARLTAVEHERLKYGCSTAEDVYEQAGITEEMLDSQRVARDYEETILSEGGNPKAHADIEAAYEVTSIVVEHVDTRKIIDLGLNLDNADALTIELRPPPRVRNNIDQEDLPPMPPPLHHHHGGLVQTEKPYNIFRTRSCNIHWKMDMERRYQQYLQQHDTNTSDSLEAAAEVMLDHHSHVISSLLEPVNTAMRVVEEVLAWAEALENDRASLPSVADMMIRRRPMDGFEEGEDDLMVGGSVQHISRGPNINNGSRGGNGGGGGRGGGGYGGGGGGGGNNRKGGGGGRPANFGDYSEDDDTGEDDEDPFAWGEDSAAMQRQGGRGTARGGRGGGRGGGGGGGGGYVPRGGRGSYNNPPRGGRGSYAPHNNNNNNRQDNNSNYNVMRTGGRGGGRGGGNGGGRGGRGAYTGGTGTFRRPNEGGAPEPL